MKGFKIWSPSEYRVIISKNIVFDENSMFNPTVKSVIVSETGSVEKQVSTKSLMTSVNHNRGDHKILVQKLRPHC